jgi:hypothetical protein
MPPVFCKLVFVPGIAGISREERHCSCGIVQLTDETLRLIDRLIVGGVADAG